MDTAITTEIVDIAATLTALGTAAMAIVVVFMIWRNVKKGANKV